ncbi:MULTISPECIES: J domain-containing protein [Cyanophyceae]|uniref:J domain-containing protein n=1 Tax=Cyanophyceae TaxID=3028117 RepID=UPI0016856D35|nr:MULTISPECIES: J domain-containing protein [Cyanophyceae]MBD1918914.1 J domain-containing protein [Phormidium sp. FACHB-77]MBD2033244.1 J domain-containing protein [Phormidium sp. FACHB-322]MBD2053823.1 J domain-containing protein [Leptolyngbya sp. FACHB-60]
MSDLRYPLHWPQGRPRRSPSERSSARYGKKGDGWGLKPLTIAEACARLRSEVEAWTKVGQTYRIPPKSVVVSSNLILTQSGGPRSGQKEPSDPGIVVYLELDGQPLALDCDRWDRAADNIAAIAFWLNAQRGAERCGVGSIAATFQGYAALPAATTEGAWYSVLGLAQMPGSSDELKAIWRSLVKKHHPDAGGDRAAWDKLQAAYQQGLQALGKVAL